MNKNRRCTAASKCFSHMGCVQGRLTKLPVDVVCTRQNERLKRRDRYRQTTTRNLHWNIHMCGIYRFIYVRMTIIKKCENYALKASIDGREQEWCESPDGKEKKRYRFAGNRRREKYHYNIYNEKKNETLRRVY